MLQSRMFGKVINLFLALMQRYNWPAKHRFFLWLIKHYPNHLITHKINNKPFVVPVDEWCFWLEKGPSHYYLDEFVPFFEAINQLKQPVSFFDLGADIGTVSVLADKYCINIKNVAAFEPNPKSFSLLSENLQYLAKDTFCQNLAVSDFSGSVAFNASSTRSLDHEGAIDPSQKGSTQVIPIDTWLSESKMDVCAAVALKIDVEGQEAQAILGAQNLIRNAQSVVILLEIHPDVLNNTDTTPEMLFEALESIREVKWYVPILDNCTVNREKAFFKQFAVKQYDVIAVLD